MENNIISRPAKQQHDDHDDDDDDDEKKMEMFFKLIRSFREARDRRRKELEETEKVSNKTRKLHCLHQSPSNLSLSFESHDFIQPNEQACRRPENQEQQQVEAQDLNLKLSL